jgi:MFS family permease
MFFFHERTRKINFWAFSFLVGPYLGPFIAGFLIQKINWRQDFGVLAAFHGFAVILIVLFGDETLYDRDHPENNVKVDGIVGKIKLLTGIAGLRATGRPTLKTVFKDLIAISYLPYLILPCKQLDLPVRKHETNCNRFYLPSRCLPVGNWHYNFSNPIHQATSISL